MKMYTNVYSHTQINRCPTLFLDFDGVLHPGHATPSDLFCKVPLLVESIAGTTIRIVISSSWRFQRTYKEIESHFPQSVREKFVGATGEAFIGRYARWQEIQSYVKAQKILNWRALDDSHFEFPNLCSELILCEGSRGLEQRQVAQIREWAGLCL